MLSTSPLSQTPHAPSNDDSLGSSAPLMVIYAIDACDSVLKELISERVKSAEGAREFAKTFDDDHSSSDEGNIIFPGRAKMKQKRNQNRNRMPCQQCKERKVRCIPGNGQSDPCKRCQKLETQCSLSVCSIMESRVKAIAVAPSPTHPISTPQVSAHGVYPPPWVVVVSPRLVSPLPEAREESYHRLEQLNNFDPTWTLNRFPTLIRGPSHTFVQGAGHLGELCDISSSGERYARNYGVLSYMDEHFLQSQTHPSPNQFVENQLTIASGNHHPVSVVERFQPPGRSLTHNPVALHGNIGAERAFNEGDTADHLMGYDNYKPHTQNQQLMTHFDHFIAPSDKSD